MAEIVAALRAYAPQRVPRRIGRVTVLPYAPADLRIVYRRLLSETPGLQARFGLAITGVTLARRRVVKVYAGSTTFAPGVTIDCSGVGAAIGADPRLHVAPPLARRQLAGFMVRLTGLRDADGPTLPLRVPYAARRAVDDGDLPAWARFTAFAADADAPGVGWCKLNPPPEAADTASALVVARRLLDRLRREIPAFRTARLAGGWPAVMPRDGLRLRGRHVLTAAEVVAGRHFPDVAARGAWPIEFWDRRTGPRYRYLAPGAWYDVPQRCLQAEAADNLLAAGRCLSATLEAMSSVRVMGACFALGAAAGRMAVE